MPRTIHIYIHGARFPTADAEGRWVTINGTHVYIENGKVVKGPAALVGKSEGEAHGGAAPHTPKTEHHHHAKLGEIAITTEVTEHGYRGKGHVANDPSKVLSLGTERSTEEEALADMRKAFRIKATASKPARPTPELSGGEQTDTHSIFGASPVEAPTDVTFHQKPTTKKVDASKLIPSQPVVWNEMVRGYKKGDGDRLPEVVISPSGEHVLIDGHHLAAAQITAGATSLKVAIVGEMNSATSTKHPDQLPRDGRPSQIANARPARPSELRSVWHQTTTGAVLEIMRAGALKPVRELSPEIAEEAYDPETHNGADLVYFGMNRAASEHAATGHGVMLNLDVRELQDRSWAEPDMEGGLIMVKGRIPADLIESISFDNREALTPEGREIARLWHALRDKRKRSKK